MAAMDSMRSMPGCEMSSRRPRNGETYAAPARAASSAWFAEKIRVQLVGMPSAESTLMAFRPSAVMGIFTTMCFGSSA